MCSSSSPVRTGNRSPARLKAEPGVTSSPLAADSQGKRAPRLPALLAAARATERRWIRSGLRRCALGDLDRVPQALDPPGAQPGLHRGEQLADPCLRWIGPLRLGNQVDLAAVETLRDDLAGRAPLGMRRMGSRRSTRPCIECSRHRLHPTSKRPYPLLGCHGGAATPCRRRQARCVQPNGSLSLSPGIASMAE